MDPFLYVTSANGERSWLNPNHITHIMATFLLGSKSRKIAGFDIFVAGTDKMFSVDRREEVRAIAKLIGVKLTELSTEME